MTRQELSKATTMRSADEEVILIPGGQEVLDALVETVVLAKVVDALRTLRDSRDLWPCNEAIKIYHACISLRLP